MKPPLFVPDSITFRNTVLRTPGQMSPVHVTPTARPTINGTLYLEDGTEVAICMPLTDDEWSTLKELQSRLRDRVVENLRTLVSPQHDER